MNKNLLMLAALTASVINVTPSHASEKENEASRNLPIKADTASVSLQAAQVVSTRAGKRTPMAYNNLTKKDIAVPSATKNYDRDISCRIFGTF